VLSQLKPPIRPTRRIASADDFVRLEEEVDLDRRVLVTVEPWTVLASMLSAKVLRIVPSVASAGLVAPITSRLRFTASSPSSTWTTTGPLVMKSHSSPKNRRSLCTA
jgi:hypothetical protein